MLLVKKEIIITNFVCHANNQKQHVFEFLVNIFMSFRAIQLVSVCVFF